MKHHHDHDASAVDCGIITVSDTRTEANDTSGQRIRQLLSDSGHTASWYQIVQDEPGLIVDLIGSAPASARVIICNGGTGIARRDTTYEAIHALIEREITGFGELFRMLSFTEIGAAAMLSRATAGVAGNRVIFSLPGSTAAVELAMTKLILPQLRHIAGLLKV